MNMGCQIGGAVTASLTPYIAIRFGWNSAFVFAAALAISGGALWVLVDPSRNQGRRANAVPADSRAIKSALPVK
jgi:ACS family glucarate transporter-like MFS transporter